MKEGAWKKLYSQYKPVLIGIARKRGLVPEECEEVAQECFLRLLIHYGKLRDVRAAGGYLTQIAKNLISDKYRKKDVWIRRWGALLSLDALLEEHKVEPRDLGLPSEPNTESIERIHRILRELEKLDPETSMIIWMHLVEDMSYKELAELLGKRENTLAVRSFRGIEKLRAQILKEDSEASGTEEVA